MIDTPLYDCIFTWNYFKLKITIFMSNGRKIVKTENHNFFFTRYANFLKSFITMLTEYMYPNISYTKSAIRKVLHSLS